jgi:hypothetical protein
VKELIFFFGLQTERTRRSGRKAGTWECRVVFMWIAIMGPWKLLPVLAALKTANQLYGILAPQNDQRGA